MWLETDPARCGLLPFAFEPGFEDDPYRRYVEWALDVPMVFVRRRGAYLDPGGRTFRAFLAEGLAGERATIADWEDHLTTRLPGRAGEGGRRGAGRRRVRRRAHEGARRPLEGDPLRPRGARRGPSTR